MDLQNILKRYRVEVVICLLFILSRVYFLSKISFPEWHPYWSWQLMSRYQLDHYLFESVYYLHSQPPLFNLYVGLIRYFFGSWFFLFHQLLMFGFGLVIFVLFYKIMRNIGVRESVSFSIVFVSLFNIEYFLYEVILLYHYFCLFFLFLSLYLLQKCVKEQSERSYFLFFFVLTLPVLTWSLFHPLWYLTVVLFVSYLLSQNLYEGNIVSTTRVNGVVFKRVFSTSFVFILLILVLLLKYYLLFGVYGFGTFHLNFSFGSNVLSKFSTDKLLEYERDGYVSELVSNSLYGSRFKCVLPASFERYGIDVMDFSKVKVINPNTQYCLDYSNQLRDDALSVFVFDKSGYLESISKNLKQFSNVGQIPNNKGYLLFPLIHSYVSSTDVFFSYVRKLIFPVFFVFLGYLLYLVYSFRGVGMNYFDQMVFLTFGFVFFVVFLFVFTSIFITFSESSKYRVLASPFLLIFLAYLIEGALRGFKKYFRSPAPA